MTRTLSQSWSQIQIHQAAATALAVLTIPTIAVFRIGWYTDFFRFRAAAAAAAAGILDIVSVRYQSQVRIPDKKLVEGRQGLGELETGAPTLLV